MPANEARTYRHIEVQPVGGSLGAEIRGVNVSATLDDLVIAEIRQAFLDHLVIFFRDQKLTPHEQLAFARRFGEPMEYPQLRGLPECPLITPVLKLAHETVNFGGVWRSDTTYLPQPPMASMLYAVELPPYGGDTIFANQYAAYETLSEGLRRTLDGLIGVNTSTKADASKTREDRLKAAGVEMKVLVSEHPVVRTHPVTNRKALYVNRGFTSHIVGVPRDESDAILRYLYEHCENPLFQCRFRWTENAIAFWDNRCTQHRAMWDYWPHTRAGTRVTVKGERPF